MNTQDTSVYIFDYLYTCRVPLHATLSETEMRVFGTLHTGNSDLDKGTKEQYVTVMWSIAKMATQFSKGDNIKIAKYSDTEEIYNRVQNHLLAWKEKLEFAINIGNAPLDDLIKLDQFANSVYEHAKYNFTQEYVQSLFMRDLVGLSAVNSGNIFKTKKPTTELKPDSKIKVENENRVSINSDNSVEKKEREALADVFKSKTVSGHRWR